MCLIFERPAPEMPNICGICQCLCMVGEWGGLYAKHDGIREESFEWDTHVGHDFLRD